MPSYVIKVDPSRDEYVYWSTVVEAPIAWGSRADLLAELVSESDPYLRDDAPHHPNNRMARADEFGTSCNDLGDGLRFYSWDEADLIYQQDGTISRDDLWALCSRIERDEPVVDLIEPFEDDGVGL